MYVSVGCSPRGVRSKLHSPRIFFPLFPFPESLIILATNLHKARCYDDLSGEGVGRGEVEDEGVVNEDGVVGEGRDIGGFLNQRFGT